MTIILLTIFLWMIGEYLLGDEEVQAAKFEKLWKEFLEDSGVDLD